LEALGLVWLFLLQGEIMQGSTPIELLCAGLPREFAEYLHSVRALHFRDEPDYAGYRALFTRCFLALEYVFDYEYDWVADRRALVTISTPKGIASARKRGREDDEQQITPPNLRARLGTPGPPQPRKNGREEVGINQAQHPNGGADVGKRAVECGNCVC
jgi:hypothetical protein